MNLAGRVQKILLQPKAEWPVIDAEAASVGQLYAGYIIPLSAIPPIASFIGMSVFGITMPFLGTVRIPLARGLASAAIQYVLGLVAVFILALIIDALAPTFGGQKNQVQALKVAAYASTASWIAGVFHIVPLLGILALLGGLYSLFLLYLGLPALMKSPQDKALVYTVVVIVCAIVLMVVVSMVAGLGLGLQRMATPAV